VHTHSARMAPRDRTEPALRPGLGFAAAMGQHSAALMGCAAASPGGVSPGPGSGLIFCLVFPFPPSPHLPSASFQSKKHKAPRGFAGGCFAVVPAAARLGYWLLERVRVAGVCCRGGGVLDGVVGAARAQLCFCAARLLACALALVLRSNAVTSQRSMDLTLQASKHMREQTHSLASGSPLLPRSLGVISQEVRAALERQTGG
jgi:hypothetical protein